MAASPSPRIRGRLNQRIRAIHLAASPLCVACAKRGRTRLAEQVDHIDPIDKGGIESRDPFLNRQALCVECHKEKTVRDFGHRPTIGVDGWPVDPQDRSRGRGG